MEIHDAESTNGTRIPDEGALIEVEIKAIPALRSGPIKKCFMVAQYRGVFAILDKECPSGGPYAKRI